MLACCGLQVPMISGRGLGATGGTLDKLEAIPGFRTNLSMDEVRDVVGRVGCVITGATADLVPADRKLYALRDVTATVPSIPLITASIMSKKLAEGLDALVLDVKWGSGAFMKTADQARELARSLVATGKRMGVATTALLTDMNQPLGRMAGNAVEVDESVAALEGRGPADLMEVTLALGAELLVFGRRWRQRSDAGRAPTLQQTIDSGAAREKFAEMVRAQGGDLDAPRPVAPASEVAAPARGYVAAIDAEAARPGDHRHGRRPAAARRQARPLDRHRNARAAGRPRRRRSAARAALRQARRRRAVCGPSLLAAIQHRRQAARQARPADPRSHRVTATQSNAPLASGASREFTRGALLRLAYFSPHFLCHAGYSSSSRSRGPRPHVRIPGPPFVLDVGQLVVRHAVAAHVTSACSCRCRKTAPTAARRRGPRPSPRRAADRAQAPARARPASP